jgi:hypothetical protein
MSKKTFIHDGKYASRFSRRRRILGLSIKFLASVVLLAGILYLALIGYRYGLSRRIEKTYESFILSCEQQDYAAAIETYRTLHDKVLSESFLPSEEAGYRELLVRLEQSLDDRIVGPFNALKERRIPLSEDDRTMFSSFEEIASMRVNRLVNEYLISLLMGEVLPEDVRFTLSELKTVESMTAFIVAYESEIPAIEAFSPTMKSIRSIYGDGNYEEVLRLTQDAIEDQRGFVREFLLDDLLKTKTVAYDGFVTEIDIMMSMGKYYSAKALLDQLMPFYPMDAALTARFEECQSFTKMKLVAYSKPVEHLAIRPLISTPGFRFADNEYSRTAEDLMITADEFRKMLVELYERDFVLIDMQALIDDKGRYHPIWIPENKKPLILSIEGLNYYASRRRTGNSINLSLDKEGNVVSEYVGENGVLRTDRNGEAIGILEQFLEIHPDFSFDGAKGTISLTGFECIFGYVTDQDQVDDRTAQFQAYGLGNPTITSEEIRQNRIDAQAVIDRLIATGWTFSSSTYGNITISDATIDQVKADTLKWKAQVASQTGAAKVLLFPNGGIVNSKDPRGAFLIGEGFLIHCGIGPTAYFNIGEKNLFMDRIALNGFALRNADLSRFMDVRNVYDKSRTKKLP